MPRWQKKQCKAGASSQLLGLDLANHSLRGCPSKRFSGYRPITRILNKKRGYGRAPTCVAEEERDARIYTERSALRRRSAFCDHRN